MGRAGRAALRAGFFFKRRRVGPGLVPGLEPFITTDSMLNLGIGFGPGFGPEFKQSNRAGPDRALGLIRRARAGIGSKIQARWTL